MNLLSRDLKKKEKRIRTEWWGMVAWMEIETHTPRRSFVGKATSSCTLERNWGQKVIPHDTLL
jgi:hypothetical protein